MQSIIAKWNAATVLIIDSASVPTEILKMYKTVIFLNYKEASSKLDDYDLQLFIDSMPSQIDLNVIDLESHIEEQLAKQINKPKNLLGGLFAKKQGDTDNKSSEDETVPKADEKQVKPMPDNDFTDFCCY